MHRACIIICVVTEGATDIESMEADKMLRKYGVRAAYNVLYIHTRIERIGDSYLSKQFQKFSASCVEEAGSFASRRWSCSWEEKCIRVGGDW